MNALVFLKPNKIDSEPFTTSTVVARCAEIQHHTVTRLIQQHSGDFEEFGILRFEIEEIDGRGQPAKQYCLNEQQATLLITYLRNTEPVRAFKKELVRQFYAMRSELYARNGYRQQLKTIRREMTDAIQAVPDVSKWAYKQYTDLAYKSAIGKNAAQIRKERGADKKAKAVDYMTAEEIYRISKEQNHIATLIELGMDYYQIKSILTERLVIGKIA